MRGSCRSLTMLALVGLMPVLAGCGSGGGLTTGTLLGGASQPTPQATVAPETPTDRAVHVGTTSARAQRCGYVFDAASVRQAYLASEQQAGLAPDQLAKAEKSYDYTVASISKAIAGEEDYCSDERTGTIKRDLNQVLAGNFAAPVKRAVQTSNWWGTPTSNDKFDREKILHPSRAEK